MSTYSLSIRHKGPTRSINFYIVSLFSVFLFFCLILTHLIPNVMYIVYSYIRILYIPPPTTPP